MDWDKLVQLLVNGLTLGSVYALVALGFSLVYGILKLLNLAHGDVVMVGAFLGWPHATHVSAIEPASSGAIWLNTSSKLRSSSKGRASVPRVPK